MKILLSLIFLLSFSFSASADTSVRVLLANQQLGPSLTVYCFHANGVYAGVTAKTNVESVAAFNLETGEYKFRHTYEGVQFWSGIISAGGNAQINIPAPTQVFLSVSNQPGGENQTIYPFTATGVYLGYTKKTNAMSQASFNLPPGNYKFRYTYDGVQFWSNPVMSGMQTAVQVPAPTPVLLSVSSMPGGENQTIYPFTAAGIYVGYTKTTNTNSTAYFNLPTGDYKFRYTYNGVQFWSDIINAENSALINIPAPTPVTVKLGTQPLGENLVVYPFTAADAYIGYTKKTDASSTAYFNLPAGEYKFRYTHNGVQFWSAAAISPDTAEIIIPQPTAVTVKLGNEQLGAGLTIYPFTAEGAYVGYTKTTDTSSTAYFDLPAGEYKFRYTYEGVQFWSETGPAFAQTQIIIPLPTSVSLQLDGQNLGENLTIYPFTADDTYIGYTKKTNADSIAWFNLPAGDYKFRYTYEGVQFWSDIISAENNALINIPAPTAVTLMLGSQPLGENLTIYPFTTAGVYVGYTKTTDADSIAWFNLPAGDYKFRYTYEGVQFWSNIISAGTAGEINLPSPVTAVTVKLGTQPLGEELTVYPFTADGIYIGYTKKTDAGSIAYFDLPAGDYKFRYTYEGVQFWSEIIPASTQTDIYIPLPTPVSLQLDGQNLGENLTVYPFTADGTYIGYTKKTNADSIAYYNLPANDYKFRYTYDGVQFWSDIISAENNALINIPAPTQVTLKLDSLPLGADQTVYPFTAAGTYVGYTKKTDADSTAHFNLPSGDYKFRYTYNGYQFFSPLVSAPATIQLTIPEAYELTFQNDAAPIADTTVYVFLESGEYFGLSRKTDTNGQLTFNLPAQNKYKFRISCDGEQHFTPVYEGPGQYFYNTVQTAEVSFSSSEISVSENSADPYLLIATLSAPLNKDTTVPFSTSSTLSPSEYILSASFFTFPAGTTSSQVSIEVLDDTTDEWDESLTIELQSATGISPGEYSSFVYTVIDDDNEPFVRFSTTSQNSLESVSDCLVSFELSASSEKTISVSYVVRSEADWTEQSLFDDEISFERGTLTTAIAFEVFDDSDTERDEEIVIILTDAINAVIDTENAELVHTILDDDGFIVQGNILIDSRATGLYTTMVVHSLETDEYDFVDAMDYFYFKFSNSEAPYNLHFYTVADGRAFYRKMPQLSIETTQDIEFSFGSPTQSLVYLSDKGVPYSEITTLYLFEQNNLEIAHSTATFGLSFGHFDDSITGDYLLGLQVSGMDLIGRKISFPVTSAQLVLGDPIRLSVINQGLPLPNQSVQVWNENSPSHIHYVVTNNDGIIEFPSLADQSYLAQLDLNSTVYPSPRLFSGDSFNFIPSSTEPITEIRHTVKFKSGTATKLLLYDSEFNYTGKYLSIDKQGVVTAPFISGMYYLGQQHGNQILLSDLKTFPQDRIMFAAGEPIKVTVETPFGALKNQALIIQDQFQPHIMLDAITDKNGEVEFPTLYGHKYNLYWHRGFNKLIRYDVFPGENVTFQSDEQVDQALANNYPSLSLKLNNKPVEIPYSLEIWPRFSPDNPTMDYAAYQDSATLIGPTPESVSYFQGPTGVYDIQVVFNDSLSWQFSTTLPATDEEQVIELEDKITISQNTAYRSFSDSIVRIGQGDYETERSGRILLGNEQGEITIFPLKGHQYYARMYKRNDIAMRRELQNGENHNFGNSLPAFIQSENPAILPILKNTVATDYSKPLYVNRETIGSYNNFGIAYFSAINTTTTLNYLLVKSQGEPDIISDTVIAEASGFSISMIKPEYLSGLLVIGFASPEHGDRLTIICYDQKNNLIISRHDAVSQEGISDLVLMDGLLGGHIEAYYRTNSEGALRKIDIEAISGTISAQQTICAEGVAKFDVTAYFKLNVTLHATRYNYVAYSLEDGQVVVAKPGLPGHYISFVLPCLSTPNQPINISNDLADYSYLTFSDADYEGRLSVSRLNMKDWTEDYKLIQLSTGIATSYAFFPKYVQGALVFKDSQGLHYGKVDLLNYTNSYEQKTVSGINTTAVSQFKANCDGGQNVHVLCFEPIRQALHFGVMNEKRFLPYTTLLLSDGPNVGSLAKLRNDRINYFDGDRFRSSFQWQISDLNGDTITSSYQWQISTDALHWEFVVDSTGSELTITPDMVDKYIRLKTTLADWEAEREVISLIEHINPPQVSFSSGSYSVSESEPYVELLLSLDYPHWTSSVICISAGESTLDSSDYSIQNSCTAIAPGNTTTTFRIDVVDDNIDEYTESVNISLSGFQNLRPGQLSTTALEIIDNDAEPAMFFEFPSATLNESSGTNMVQVNLSQPSQKMVSATIEASPLCNTELDYISSMDILFMPNQTSYSVEFSISDDSIDEPVEVCELMLQNSVNATPGSTPSFQIIIEDNDPEPSLYLSAGSLSRAESMNGFIPIVLSHKSEKEIILNISCSGTAQSDDYACPGQVSLVPTTTVTTIFFEVSDDQNDEEDQIILFTLNAVENAVLQGNNQFTYTILDNDPEPEVNFVNSKYRALESESFIFELQLSRHSEKNITVQLGLQPQGIDPSDLLIVPATTSFSPGQTTTQVVVVPFDDSIDEPTKSFSYEIMSATNATVGSLRTAYADLLDNDSDATIGFLFNSRQISESTTTISIELIKTGETSKTILVELGIRSELNNNEYTLSASSISFSPEQYSQIILLELLDDNYYEETESLTLSIDNIVDGDFAELREHVVSVIDDEPVPSVSFSASYVNYSEAEAAMIQIPVQLNPLSQKPVVFSLEVDTDMQSSEYELMTQEFSVAPYGQQTMIHLSIKDDQVFEIGEYLSLEIKPISDCQTGAVSTITIDISDDDPYPAVGFVSANSFIIETAAIIPINLVLSDYSDHEANVNVVLTCSGSSAIEISTDSILFTPGTTTAQIQLSLQQNTSYDGSNSCSLTLSSPIGATLQFPFTHELTIIDDEPAPMLQSAEMSLPGTGMPPQSTVNIKTVTEGDRFLVQFNLSNPLSYKTSFQVVLSGNDPETDLTINPKSLTFQPEKTNAFLNIDIINDHIWEITKIYDISFISKDPAINTSFANLRIVIDDNDQPEISFSEQKGSTVVTTGTIISLPVVLSSPAILPLTFGVSVSGTTNLSDKYMYSNLLSINTGESLTSISITVKDASLITDTELLKISLTPDPSYCRPGNYPEHSHTIKPENPPLTFTSLISGTAANINITTGAVFGDNDQVFNNSTLIIGNHLYVAYQDEEYDQTLSLAKFDLESLELVNVRHRLTPLPVYGGASLEQVDNTLVLGFQDDPGLLKVDLNDFQIYDDVHDISGATDTFPATVRANGYIYFLFSDSEFEGKLTIHKYDEETMELMSVLTDVSPGSVIYKSVAFHQDKLYIAFSDIKRANKLSIAVVEDHPEFGLFRSKLIQEISESAVSGTGDIAIFENKAYVAYGAPLSPNDANKYLFISMVNLDTYESETIENLFNYPVKNVAFRIDNGQAYIGFTRDSYRNQINVTKMDLLTHKTSVIETGYQGHLKSMRIQDGLAILTYCNTAVSTADNGSIGELSIGKTALNAKLTPQLSLPWNYDVGSVVRLVAADITDREIASMSYSWQKNCGATFADIVNSSSTFYLIKEEDMGCWLRCAITIEEANGEEYTSHSNSRYLEPIIKFHESGLETVVEEGSGEVSIPVSLSHARQHGFHVPYTITGTATRGYDYSDYYGSVYFSPGQTQSFVRINILDDEEKEPTEYLRIQLRDVAGFRVRKTPYAIVSILDNEPNNAPYPVSAWDENSSDIASKLLQETTDWHGRFSDSVICQTSRSVFIAHVRSLNKASVVLRKLNPDLMSQDKSATFYLSDYITDIALVSGTDASTVYLCGLDRSGYIQILTIDTESLTSSTEIKTYFIGRGFRDIQAVITDSEDLIIAAVRRNLCVVVRFPNSGTIVARGGYIRNGIESYTIKPTSDGNQFKLAFLSSYRQQVLYLEQAMYNPTTLSFSIDPKIVYLNNKYKPNSQVGNIRILDDDSILFLVREESEKLSVLHYQYSIEEVKEFSGVYSLNVQSAQLAGNSLEDYQVIAPPRYGDNWFLYSANEQAFYSKYKYFPLTGSYRNILADFNILPHNGYVYIAFNTETSWGLRKVSSGSETSPAPVLAYVTPSNKDRLMNAPIARIGTTLSISKYELIDPDGPYETVKSFTYEYQWQSSPDGDNWTDIGKDTWGSYGQRYTFLPPANLENHYIRAKLIVWDGYAMHTVYSSPVFLIGKTGATVSFDTAFQTVVEGETAHVGVTLSKSLDYFIELGYEIVHDGSKSGASYDDYEMPFSRKIAFYPGQTKAQISIPISLDNIQEGFEYLQLALVGGGYSDIVDFGPEAIHTIQIADLDSYTTFSSEREAPGGSFRVDYNHDVATQSYPDVLIGHEGGFFDRFISCHSDSEWYSNGYWCSRVGQNGVLLDDWPIYMTGLAYGYEFTPVALYPEKNTEITDESFLKAIGLNFIERSYEDLSLDIGYFSQFGVPYQSVSSVPPLSSIGLLYPSFYPALNSIRKANNLYVVYRSSADQSIFLIHYLLDPDNSDINMINIKNYTIPGLHPQSRVAIAVDDYFAFVLCEVLDSSSLENSHSLQLNKIHLTTLAINATTHIDNITNIHPDSLVVDDDKLSVAFNHMELDRQQNEHVISRVSTFNKNNLMLLNNTNLGKPPLIPEPFSDTTVQQPPTRYAPSIHTSQGGIASMHISNDYKILINSVSDSRPEPILYIPYNREEHWLPENYRFATAENEIAVPLQLPWATRYYFATTNFSRNIEKPFYERPDYLMIGDNVTVHVPVSKQTYNQVRIIYNWETQKMNEVWQTTKSISYTGSWADFYSHPDGAGTYTYSNHYTISPDDAGKTLRCMIQFENLDKNFKELFITEPIEIKIPTVEIQGRRYELAEGESISFEGNFSNIPLDSEIALRWTLSNSSDDISAESLSETIFASASDFSETFYLTAKTDSIPEPEQCFSFLVTRAELATQPSRALMVRQTHPIELCIQDSNNSVPVINILTQSIIVTEANTTIKIPLGCNQETEWEGRVKLTQSFDPNVKNLSSDINVPDSLLVCNSQWGESHITVQLSDNDWVDTSERKFRITLTEDQYIDIGANNSVDISILDDDGPPELNIYPPHNTVSETDGTIDLVASLSKFVAQTVTCNVHLTGTARGALVGSLPQVDTDYYYSTNEISFFPGQKQKYLHLEILRDHIDEIDRETVNISLQNCAYTDSITDYPQSEETSTTIYISDEDSGNLIENTPAESCNGIFVEKNLYYLSPRTDALGYYHYSDFSTHTPVLKLSAIVQNFTGTVFYRVYNDSQEQIFDSDQVYLDGGNERLNGDLFPLWNGTITDSEQKYIPPGKYSIRFIQADDSELDVYLLEDLNLPDTSDLNCGYYLNSGLKLNVTY